MNNKRQLFLALCACFVLPFAMALSACGHEAEVGDGEYHISHDLDMKFDNCFVCHTGGPFPAGGESPYREDHDAYELEMCSTPECHPSEQE